MAIRAEDATPESPREALGPGRDLPIARVVALLLILLPIGAWFATTNLLNAGPAQPATDLTTFNPRSIFTDSTPHFLPTPVAALPAESNAGPPAPATADQAVTASAPAVELVKVANTGGVGAILRSDPPRGRQVGVLRDGTILQVLEHRQLGDDSEWLRVKTPEAQEGWVYSRLVAAAQ